MISSVTIQQDYNQLYRYLRNYLWDYRTLNDICELELACYTAFPSIKLVTSCLRRVKQDVLNILRIDEDVESQFNQFENDLEDACDTFLKIPVSKEVTT